MAVRNRIKKYIDAKSAFDIATNWHGSIQNLIYAINIEIVTAADKQRLNHTYELDERMTAEQMAEVVIFFEEKGFKISLESHVMVIDWTRPVATK